MQFCQKEISNKRFVNTIIFLLLFLFTANSLRSQVKSAVTLPAPTGKYAVGTTVFQWLNYSLKDTFTIYPNDYREVAVQLWYPALKTDGAVKAAYAPLYAGADSVTTNSWLLADFAADIAKAPLVIFCPGRGVSKHEYTIMAEELASKGFAVASIDMPYIGATVLLDGRYIKPAPQFRIPGAMLSGPYEKVDSFFQQANLIGAADVTLVINGLKMQNENKRSVLFGKLDMNNIGIFGHSLGGRIAGQALYDNKGIKAYLSMEGIAPPLVRKGGINKPMCYLLSEGLVKFAMQNYMDAVPGRKGLVYITVLTDFGHNSFTDFMFTAPGTYNYKVEENEAYRIGRKLMTSYFQQHLQGKDTFLADMKLEDKVKIEVYK
jgi:dienelactone hydrolase